MRDVTEDILRSGTTDVVSIVEVEQIVVDNGVFDPHEVRRVADEAIRDLVLRDLAVIGYVNGPGGSFRAWPESGQEALNRLAREWNEADRNDNANYIAWLNLTDAGEHNGRELVAWAKDREEQVMLELARRWPALKGHLDLADPGDRRRFTMETLAREAALGIAPSFREKLEATALRAVLASVDEIYDRADDSTRRVIFRRLAVPYAIPGVADDARVEQVLGNLGSGLRKRLKERHRVWRAWAEALDAR